MLPPTSMGFAVTASPVGKNHAGASVRTEVWSSVVLAEKVRCTSCP